MTVHPEYRHFSISEFDQKDLPGSGENMCTDYMSMLDELRDQVGFPFVVTSGWRSPEYNNSISSTGLAGPHTTGKAADISCTPEQMQDIVRVAMRLKLSADEYFFSGIGIGKNFIHLDCLSEEEGFPRPRIWTYEESNYQPQEEDRKIFVVGRTAFDFVADLVSLPNAPGVVLLQHGRGSKRYVFPRRDKVRGVYIGA